jgi:hypothetical protein
MASIGFRIDVLNDLAGRVWPLDPIGMPLPIPGLASGGAIIAPSFINDNLSSFSDF